MQYAPTVVHALGPFGYPAKFAGPRRGRPQTPYRTTTFSVSGPTLMM